MPWMWPNSIGRPAGFLFCFGTKKHISTHPVNVSTQTTWPPRWKSSRCTERTVRAPWSLCPKCNVAAADSSALQTPAEINEVISETLKQRAKEFMNLPLPLLTVHRQIFFRKVLCTSSVLWAICKLSPFFKAAERMNAQVGRFTVWMESIHPSKVGVHPERYFCQEYFTFHVA